MTATVRRLVMALVVVLVALPGARTIVQGREAPDGFPISTYPMFTRDRGRLVEVPSVVITEGDEVDRLSPSAIADTDQVIEAHEVVARAVREHAADELCREVAGRVDLDGGEQLEVVLERYDTIAWASGDDEPLQRRVVASCS